VTQDAPDLDHPKLYGNREMGFLAFNRRVLEQVNDPSVPLLERVRFLAICCSNLDEFFEVRVSGLRQQLEFHVEGASADGLSPLEALQRVSHQAHELVREQYAVFTDRLLPALESEGIRVSFRQQWTAPIRRWARGYFSDHVLPVLTPVGLDPSHPFPAVLNKSLNFIVSVHGRDAFGRGSRFAVVQAPRVLPRLIRLPTEIAERPDHFVTLSGVLHDSIDRLFPGMEIEGCHPFRVTRNSELWVDEEDVSDLLLALKGELPHRHFGAAVRLEVGRHSPPEINRFLLEQFRLQEQDLYQVQGPVNLHRISALCDEVDRPDLKYPAFAPALPPALRPDSDLFAAIARREILLHHPYDAFAPVLDLLRQAAADPAVLAIKITLYRTGEASPLADALVEAARAGKEVTAAVELRARFDEAANIDIASRLQREGAKVAYGIVGFKAHAKMMLIVRRERGGLRRYVHLGTGNYHPRTSRAYTDLGLLTCDPDLGEDVHQVFQQLTGLGSVPSLRKLLLSPFSMHERVLAAIDAETRAAREGKPAGIRAKLNSLIDPEVIRALYRASQAGVPVDLVVRGVCCLRPDVPGVSERIQVRSIIGRFLEHSRVYHFHAGGKEEVFASSADWMPRNFFRRVEVAFPIESAELRRKVLEECLDLPLSDNTQAWRLGSDGTYTRVKPEAGDSPRCSQSELMRRRQ